MPRGVSVPSRMRTMSAISRRRSSKATEIVPVVRQLRTDRSLAPVIRARLLCVTPMSSGRRPRSPASAALARAWTTGETSSARACFAIVTCCASATAFVAALAAVYATSSIAPVKPSAPFRPVCRRALTCDVCRDQPAIIRRPTPDAPGWSSCDGGASQADVRQGGPRRGGVADCTERIARGVSHGAYKAPAGADPGTGRNRARMSAGTLGGHVNDWGTDERGLARRCREGSEAAYAELVRQHRPRLYSLAFRLIGDREAAEDVVQETFLAAFKAIDRFQPKPSLAPWLNTIAVRIAQRAAARGRARPKASLDRLVASGDSLLALSQPVELDPASDPHTVAEAGELRRAVAAAIEGLPFTPRAAGVLRLVLGLDSTPPP